MRTMPKYEIDFLTEYGDEALLNEIRRIAALLSQGERLTGTAFKRLSPRVSYSAIRRRFGGWKEALEKAGLGHLYHGQPVSQKMRLQPAKRLSNADLIDELKRVHRIVGTKWLTTDQFNANSIVSEEVIRARFGTFRKGLQVAGISFRPAKLPKFSDEECFQNLRRLDAAWTPTGISPDDATSFKNSWKIVYKAVGDLAQSSQGVRRMGK